MLISRTAKLISIAFLMAMAFGCEEQRKAAAEASGEGGATIIGNGLSGKRHNPANQPVNDPPPSSTPDQPQPQNSSEDDQSTTATRADKEAESLAPAPQIPQVSPTPNPPKIPSGFSDADLTPRLFDVLTAPCSSPLSEMLTGDVYLTKESAGVPLNIDFNQTDVHITVSTSASQRKVFKRNYTYGLPPADYAGSVTRPGIQCSEPHTDFETPPIGNVPAMKRTVQVTDTFGTHSLVWWVVKNPRKPSTLLLYRLEITVSGHDTVAFKTLRSLESLDP